MMKMRFWALLLFLLFTFTAHANSPFLSNPSLLKFIEDMVHRHHFKQKELVNLFNHVYPRPKVIQKLKTPYEQKPWYIYQQLFVTDWRIQQGVEFWKKHQKELERAELTFGVPAGIIVATIGVETKYGQNKGDFPVIEALTNLAFGENTSRMVFFRKELEEFLLLSREQHLNPLKIMGSYAGAIGQPQFMPSSYRHYAVNFSGNQYIDLSNNEVDVIGSIANFYSKHGWKKSQAVAIPASIRGNNQPLKLLSNRVISINEVIFSEKIPNKQIKSKLLQLQGYYGNEYWISYPNFDVIKRYNTSNLYAMAVFQLSCYINALREKTINENSL